MAKIIIIGGGIIGSSLAWNLAKSGAGTDVIVVEPDPSYEFAATPRAVGGVRFVQGLRENLLMSLYGQKIFKNFQKIVDIEKDHVELGFHECGYLFLGKGTSADAFQANHQMLTAHGAEIELLDRPKLMAFLPSFNFDDVDVALYSPRDARIDPYAALQGYRKAAIRLGIVYKKDRVVDINHNGSTIRSVSLDSGQQLPAELVINAANCWAPEICSMVRMPIPIEPVRRQTFFFDMKNQEELFPAIRDHTGLSVRPDSSGFITGKTAVGGKTGFNWDLDHREFDDELWPLMAHRNKSFEVIKYKGGWVGHYDQNKMDANPILGHWKGGISNFIIAAGFSGHGLQHAPAVSLGLSELIQYGEYRTFDLSLFSYERVANDKPIEDTGPTP